MEMEKDKYYILLRDLKRNDGTGFDTFVSIRMNNAETLILLERSYGFRNMIRVVNTEMLDEDLKIFQFILSNGLEGLDALVPAMYKSFCVKWDKGCECVIPTHVSEYVKSYELCPRWHTDKDKNWKAYGNVDLYMNHPTIYLYNKDGVLMRLETREGVNNVKEG